MSIEKSPRYLLCGEPVSTFHPELDSGVALAKEILSRGFQLDYCDLTQADYNRTTEVYLSHIPVAQVLSGIYGVTPAFELGKVRLADVNEYQVILQRKDPPVDEIYRGHAAHYAKAPQRIVQMNHSAMTIQYSEHLLPQRYPEFGVHTTVCESFGDFMRQVRQSEGETVAKPFHLFSGIGIEFFSAKTPENILQTYWETYKPKVIVQPYISEITTLGDVRILVMNQRVLGAVRRVPKKGSRLANFHQGASAEAATPTPKQLAACAAVGKDLCPQGLYLLGLDFIGDYLTEVNITCPSALRQVNEFNRTQVEKIIINELEGLRAKP